MISALHSRNAGQASSLILLTLLFLAAGAVAEYDRCDDEVAFIQLSRQEHLGPLIRPKDPMKQHDRINQAKNPTFTGKVLEKKHQAEQKPNHLKDTLVGGRQDDEVAITEHDPRDDEEMFLQVSHKEYRKKQQAEQKPDNLKGTLVGGSQVEVAGSAQDRLKALISHASVADQKKVQDHIKETKSQTLNGEALEKKQQSEQKVDVLKDALVGGRQAKAAGSEHDRLKALIGRVSLTDQKKVQDHIKEITNHTFTGKVLEKKQQAEQKLDKLNDTLLGGRQAKAAGSELDRLKAILGGASVADHKKTEAQVAHGNTEFEQSYKPILSLYLNKMGSSDSCRRQMDSLARYFEKQNELVALASFLTNKFGLPEKTWHEIKQLVLSKMKVDPDFHGNRFTLESVLVDIHSEDYKDVPINMHAEE